MDIINLSSPLLKEKVIKELSKLPSVEGLLIKNGRSHAVTALGALQVKKLRIHNSEFTHDCWPDLSHFQNLEILEIFSFGVKSLAGFPALPRLRQFTLRAGEGVFDINPLAGCPNMRALDLEGLPILSPAPLASLFKLSRLKLGHTGLPGLDWIAGLTRLTELEIYSNGLESTASLAGLTKLKELKLGGNRIHDVFPLSGLKTLTMLNLEKNAVADLTPLAALNNLESLLLSGNRITDVTPLAGLQGLRVLDLADNPLSDAAPLAGMSSLELLALPAGLDLKKAFAGYEIRQDRRGHGHGKPDTAYQVLKRKQ